MIWDVLFILVVTGAVLFPIRRRASAWPLMTGMMISMGVAMLSSTVVGVLLGMMMGRSLTLASMSAVWMGLLIGMGWGRPFGSLAAWSAVGSGFMGGLMGAMIGVMVVEPTLLLWFLNLFFVFAILFLVRVLGFASTLLASRLVQVGILASLAGLALLFVGTLTGVFLLGDAVCGVGRTFW